MAVTVVLDPGEEPGTGERRERREADCGCQDGGGHRQLQHRVGQEDPQGGHYVSLLDFP